MQPRLGIVGGAGALASAEFVRTIYEYNLGDIEQQSPVVLMYSDPTFPDRTQAVLSGSDGLLLDSLIGTLERLQRLEASKIVICCITFHYLLPRLPEHLKNRIISLIDVILAHVIEARERQLLLCSTGTRTARLFQRHPKWPRASDYIVWPDAHDQEMIHNSFYQYKTRSGVQPLLPHLEGFFLKYRADSFIAGCSELHLLTKHLVTGKAADKAYKFIDPLFIIAKNLAVFL